MVILAGIGLESVGTTGTLGGCPFGNYTEIDQAQQHLGWENYATFYLSDLTLLIIASVTVVLTALEASDCNKTRA